MYQVTIQFKSQRNSLNMNIENDHIKSFINAIENKKLYKFSEEVGYFFNINEIEQMIVNKKSNVIKDEKEDVKNGKEKEVKKK